MDIKTLKAKYPDVAQALIEEGRMEAVEEAKQRARESVLATYKHGSGRQGYCIAGLVPCLSLRRRYVTRH